MFSFLSDIPNNKLELGRLTLFTHISYQNLVTHSCNKNISLFFKGKNFLSALSQSHVAFFPVNIICI